jgi:ribosome-associated heat shock protein Hsp15
VHVADASRVRLDRWLVAARLFKTRARAAAAVAAGRVDVNGERARRAKLVGVGDRLRIRRGPFEYHVTIRAVAARRGSPAAAARLYAEDPDARRRRERLAEQLRLAPALRYEGKGRPTKRDRRAIERLQEASGVSAPRRPGPSEA